MASQQSSNLNTIKVSDIAKCRDVYTQMDDGIRQAAIKYDLLPTQSQSQIFHTPLVLLTQTQLTPWSLPSANCYLSHSLIEKGHLTLSQNEIPSFIDQHMEPLFPVGSIHCLNRFTPDNSRCCVIARGYQVREKVEEKEEREVYAIMPLLKTPAATSTATTDDMKPPVVDEDGIVHVVLRSAVLSLPLWNVGENVYVSGAGVEVNVQVKARRFGEDSWEYSLFKAGIWDTEKGWKETFDTVSSLDNPPPVKEELSQEVGVEREEKGWSLSEKSEGTEVEQGGEGKDKVVFSDKD